MENIVQKIKYIFRRGGYMEKILANKKSNMETKRDRFVRIAERRVNKILVDLDSLGKCANRRNYQYTDSDVRKVFGEIENKLRETKALYKSSTNSKNRFRLEP